MPLRPSRELEDPCFHESEMSMRCLDDTGYDKSLCEKYFINYRACKKFWLQVKVKRTLAGITPRMPPVSEWEAYKKKFLESGEIPSKVD